MILLSGVHGVGKGYLIKKSLELLNTWEIFTASELIKKYKTEEDLGYKRVFDVRDNQRVLIDAIKKESCSNKRLILDGHLCLLNLKGEVERIPTQFFKELDIEIIILLQDEPEKIYERLLNRDGRAFSLSVINTLQLEEEKYAGYLHDKYNIEFVIFTPNCMIEEMHNLVERIR